MQGRRVAGLGDVVFRPDLRPPSHFAVSRAPAAIDRCGISGRRNPAASPGFQHSRTPPAETVGYHCALARAYSCALMLVRKTTRRAHSDHGGTMTPGRL